MFESLKAELREWRLTLGFNRVANPCAPVYDPALWNDAGELWQQDALIDLLTRHPEIENPLRHYFQNPVFSNRYYFCQSSGRPLIGFLNLLNYILKNKDEIDRIFGDMPSEAVSRFKMDFCETLPYVQLRTNCYAHAVNYRAEEEEFPGAKLQPGGLSGAPITFRTDSEGHYYEDVLSGIVRDGAKLYSGKKSHPPAREGFYRIDLLVYYEKAADEPLTDFHVIRENADGSPSHKVGHRPSGKLPGFPEILRYRPGPGTYFRKASLYVPEGGLTRQAPAPPVKPQHFSP